MSLNASWEAVSISCRLSGTTVRSQDGGGGLGKRRSLPSLAEDIRKCNVQQSTAAALYLTHTQELF